ncbi:phosphatidylinositol alpha 1,6-mannosyltransferase [Nocardiopsis arvandica]|uniref:Phosphatidylinositol alpha 1,6-mannosyltransferase n=1 Tax=Nocardiopsis sinuspersici TaxID=501010 RepID=A0A7Z0BJS9_9ACTN|nr:glycosyltransferase family 1 protein [Nocardiopsis sinuspersici]NYH54063.1 phosphatidylinositol alpha 1,6-mannosyltransferase [Nocardiopsis sinuspersici]
MSPTETRGPLRVAIVTESFLPQVNGVTNSVCRVVDLLAARGHEVLVLAPGPGPSSYAGFPVVRMPSMPLPFYRDFPVGLPARRTMTAAIRSFSPDVLHLASPALLGSAAVETARRWALPTVAVFQTDLPGFAGRHRVPGGEALWSLLRRTHAAVDRTLVPSSATMEALSARGFPRLDLWRRGVDTRLFDPARRDGELRRRLAPNGEAIVGYVGRLARDKRVDLLAHVARLRGIRLVVVGDGPERARLRRRLPDAVFTGQRTGGDLARLYASMDVFVHTGADETFCQSVQEALASGVPVVAPAAGGPLDLVVPEHNGLLYAPDSVRELRVAVGRLAHNREVRRRMAAGTRPSVEHRTWEAVGEQLLDHYRAVIAPSRELAERGTGADMVPASPGRSGRGRPEERTSTPPPSRGGRESS